MTLVTIIIYLAIVSFIGLFSHRFFRGTGEDYFLATRSIGPVILLMSLFGTHMTAFSLLGASGEAYRIGIGVFGLMASSSAIVVPLLFLLVGKKAWQVGKEFGYTTQVEYFRARWGSDKLGALIFVTLVAFLVPYLLIGVMGGGITLNEITDGQVPAWVGGLLVSVVVMVYVTAGGLRGTAWANTFQTLVFMLLGGVTFFIVIDKLGGIASAMSMISEGRPELLIRGERITPLTMVSYLYIPMSAGMFPHLFMHWLSAKDSRSFDFPVIAYPVCIAIVWIPSVLLGVFGHIGFPALQGPASNSILVMMINQYAPGVLAGLLAAGVFAAVMSSLDSQVLSLGTMFTNDIVRHYGFRQQMSEQQIILAGRLFVVVILGLTWLISLVANRSIFGLGVWSFSGFASLLPLVVAALYWRKSNKYGGYASIITALVLWIYFFNEGWGKAGYTVGETGILPAAVIVIASSAAMIVGSRVGTWRDNSGSKVK
jgi:SSS family solute:Na+ symporter